MAAGLRFHWMLPKGGEVGIQTAEATAHFRTQCYQRTSPAGRPDMEGWTRFARRAENAGIESVLISCGPYEPDPLLVACALGQATDSLKFMVAYRSGWMQPTTFVQQINTISGLIGGRVAVNLVAGSSTREQHSYGDFLDHDLRYARAAEFLTVCQFFWRGNGAVDFEGEYYRVERAILHTPFQAPDRRSPEIYVSGHSEQAEQLAYSQSDCWLRVVDTPEKLRPIVAQARERGVDVGLRLGLVCRETREEAERAARALLPKDHVGKRQDPITSKDDSQMYRDATQVPRDAEWLNRCIWLGLVPYYGPVWTSLVGTPDELTDAFLEYKEIGIKQFIISGCPELDAIDQFGREILPRIRKAERSEEGQ
ncbi:MAG: LLM class flavin-dependent oxidoreductase [Planctomycetota bacterium]